MSVAYEELPGSPSFDLERKSGSGKRSVLVAWADIVALADEIFPNPLTTGYLYGAVMPGFPWMVATKMGIKPFVEDRPRADNETDWTTWYPLAQVDVEYGVPKDDQQQQSGPSGDGTGPGGSGTSGSGGSTGGQEVTYISHKIHIGGEFITYPNNALQWEGPGKKPVASNPYATTQGRSMGVTLMGAHNATTTEFKVFGLQYPSIRGVYLEFSFDFSGPPIERMEVIGYRTNRDGTVIFNVRRGADGTTPHSYQGGEELVVRIPNASAKAQFGVSDNISNAIAIPLLEHTIEWNYVARPPWLAIRQTMGKVNAYWFAGAPPETLLFLGAEVSRDITNKGAKAWKLSYKFSEKNMNAFNPNKPFGWNHFLRSNGDDAGQFKRLCKKVGSQSLSGEAPNTYFTTGPSATTTLLTVNDTGGSFPQEGQFLIRCYDDPEIIAVTAKLNGTQWACLRGVNGTTAAIHQTGSNFGRVDQYPGGVYDYADFRYLFV